MDRQTKIVIFVITTVLSIVLILLSYFGWVRYITIYTRPLNKYIQDYKFPGKVYDRGVERIVVSLSLAPNQLKKLPNILKSLLDQTMRVDQIALNVPHCYKEQGYNIPKECKKIINVFNTRKDFGTANSILPTVKREGECGTIIIIVCDKIYGQDFVESMVEESNKYPEFAIQTNGGFLLRPEFFNESILDTDEKFDDGWKSRHLNVKRKTLRYNENYNCL
jgi:hypothetical protein